MNSREDISFLINSLFEAGSYGASRYERLTNDSRRRLRQLLEMHCRSIEEAEDLSTRKSEYFSQIYQPRYPRLFKFDADYMLDPAFLKCFKIQKQDDGQIRKVTVNTVMVQAHVEDMGNSLFSLPLISSEFCKDLIDEIKHLHS
ncbi:ogfod2 [Acrasis kona]|uniref:Ogfod2 n=1 Tax=Acrasis kona TaxID=1008807 RepID=A0AAW2YM89_9EUKA